MQTRHDTVRFWLSDLGMPVAAIGSGKALRISCMLLAGDLQRGRITGTVFVTGNDNRQGPNERLFRSPYCNTTYASSW